MPNSNYIEYNFKIVPPYPASEILIAELGERDFESFVEKVDGLLAYIQKKDWRKNILDGVSILKNPEFKIDFEFKEIEQENWNARWERSFEPIEVEGRCRVRAPFHEKVDFEYDIVVEPKMSFGTGHHETTQMMLRYVLTNDFRDNRVLDMGCGTAVLAILAEMKGASAVDAIDIDHWCFLNAQENVERNGCKNIRVLEGGSTLLASRHYDIILANINRNILLEDIPIYADCLDSGATLFLSGFYADDIPKIADRCKEFGLIFQNNLNKGQWVAVEFLKQ